MSFPRSFSPLAQLIGPLPDLFAWRATGSVFAYSLALIKFRTRWYNPPLPMRVPKPQKLNWAWRATVHKLEGPVRLTGPGLFHCS